MIGLVGASLLVGAPALLSANAAGVSDDLAMRQEILREVQECDNVLRRGDYEAWADCTPTKVTRAVGGKSWLSVKGQPQEALREAEECRNALRRKDYKAYDECDPTKEAHPVSGKRWLVQQGDRLGAMLPFGQSLRDGGATVETQTYDLPETINYAGSFLYAVVHERLISVLANAVECRFQFEKVKVAISEDGGKSWKSFEASTYTMPLFPELIGKVKIPALDIITLQRFIACGALTQNSSPVRTNPPPE
ncbi:MAG TPA: hypothetical protein VHC39_12860 [Rhizomicrobium sp.]|nr:hypothetical protein [Rhizomicrobium sp.]